MYTFLLPRFHYRWVHLAINRRLQVPVQVKCRVRNARCRILYWLAKQQFFQAAACRSTGTHSIHPLPHPTYPLHENGSHLPLLHEHETLPQQASHRLYRRLLLLFQEADNPESWHAHQPEKCDDVHDDGHGACLSLHRAVSLPLPHESAHSYACLLRHIL